MKHILLFPFLFLISAFAFSQIDITGPIDLACPGEPFTYTTMQVTSANPSCEYKWTVTNGVFSNNSTVFRGSYLSANSVTVTWSNIPFQGGNSIPQGTLILEVINCVLPDGEKTSDVENVVIKTLNGVTPGNIFGNPSIPISNTTNRTFSIPRIQFPGTGQIGGSTTIDYADSYEWLIPSGWQIGTTTSNGTTPISTGPNFSVSIKPDECTGNGGSIKVRGYSACGPGYYSNWQETPVTRDLPALAWSQAPPENVQCSNTTAITVSIAPVTGAQSYTWTIPSGWSGTSSTNTITITPNWIKCWGGIG